MKPRQWRLEDGVTHDLSPLGDGSGNFRDQDGRDVYRQSGLGDQGLIFRCPDQSVYVYWSTAALEPAGDDNPTAPFSTKDYNATALLRCRGVNDASFGSCPAGVLRMEKGQGSVVVQSQKGEQFTINFMQDYVNATNREARASLDGDTWTVTIGGKDVYEVPLAFIEGDSVDVESVPARLLAPGILAASHGAPPASCGSARWRRPERCVRRGQTFLIRPTTNSSMIAPTVAVMIAPIKPPAEIPSRLNT